MVPQTGTRSGTTAGIKCPQHRRVRCCIAPIRSAAGCGGGARWISPRRSSRRVSCSHFSIRKIEADKRRPSRGLADQLAKSVAIPEDERRAFLDAARAVQSQLLSLTNFCIPPPPLPSNSAGSVLSLAAIGKGAHGFQKQEAALPLSSGRQAGKDGRLSPSL